MFRKLLTLFRIKSRTVTILNLINQGNHVGVEVLLDGRYIFFDPTFGVFFKNKDYLSFDEVRSLDGREARKYVHALGTLPKISIFGDLELSYSHELTKSGMPLQNYHSFEDFYYETIIPKKILKLEIPISPGENIPTKFNINDSHQENDTLWLIDSNNRLNASSRRKHFSFYSKLVGYRFKGFLNLPVVVTFDLQLRHLYKLECLTSNPVSEKSIFSDAEIVSTSRNKFGYLYKIEIFFLANSTNINFYLFGNQFSKIDTSSYVKLLFRNEILALSLESI